MPTKKPLSFEGVHAFLRTLFADDLRAKRILSLAGATLGAIEAASLAVALIGQRLALARGRLTKHAIPLDALASGKQVDRLLSIPGIDVDALLVHWVPYVVGSRSSITVAMDWTDFDADGQATIMSPAALPRGLSLLWRHGRATLLVWLTVGTATLKNRRRAHEGQVLMRLAEVGASQPTVGCLTTGRKPTPPRGRNGREPRHPCRLRPGTETGLFRVAARHGAAISRARPRRR